MKSRRHAFLILAVLGPIAAQSRLATAGNADAGPGHEAGAMHTHTPLAIDPGMTWSQLVEAALAVDPGRFELAALAYTATAWQDESRNLLSGSPVFTVGVLDDGAVDNRGQSEFDAGIDLPLWRIGQKDDARTVADTLVAETSAAEAATRLRVTGVVRTALWDIALARQSLEQARVALDLTSELLRVVELRAERGDLAPADVLLARSAQYDRRVDLIESEAVLLDAERRFRSLTGLDSMPQDFAETRSAREDLDAQHPLLAMASIEVERAQAELDYTEKSRRGSPTLSLGPHRQRDPLGNYYNTSIAVGISVPLGGRNHGLVERAEAAREAAAARSRRASVERRLDLELHEAEHDLFVIEESLELVLPQAELAEQRVTLGRKAFEYGEIDLQDLLRIQDAAIAAAGSAARLRTERQRAIAAINQALGELP